MQDEINLRVAEEHDVDEIVGVSSAITRVRRSIRKIGRSNDHVLIFGEPGVGKRLIAKRIQEASYKQRAVFEIDCRALLDLNGKLEPVLYNLAQAVKSAPSPTLLLYHIEHMPEELRNLLYRLSMQQDRVLAPSLDSGNGVRILATSESNPRGLLKNHLLPTKLYNRLSQISISLPPLRRRPQDIPHLFNYFVRKFKTLYPDAAQDVRPTDALYESLLRYEWPGNIEEIKNCVRTLVLTTRRGDSLVEGLPCATQEESLRKLVGKPLGEATALVESYLINQALAQFGGNQTKAAQHLRISEASLRYKLKKYKLRKEN
jgi:DNA-binding NtrC family response regulator